MSSSLLFDSSSTHCVERFGAKFSNLLKGRMYVSATQALPIYYFIVAIIVHFSRHWSNVHIGVAIASFSFIPACFIPESPRWLAQNNRHEEAFEVMIQRLFCLFV